MADKKLSDNEIVKALEDAREMEQEDVVIYYEDVCTLLDLINRQKAEIERLEKGSLKEAMTFNSKTIANIKAEAIKEFAEIVKSNKDKLFNYIYSSRGSDEQIDNLVKEMVGE